MTDVVDASTEHGKLVEDARAALVRAAAAARMIGVVSSLSRAIHDSPRTLGEMHAFSSAVASSVLAIGFLRPEVREAYREVLDAAVTLSNRVWQARRNAHVVVLVDEPATTGGGL